MLGPRSSDLEKKSRQHSRNHDNGLIDVLSSFLDGVMGYALLRFDHKGKNKHKSAVANAIDFFNDEKDKKKTGPINTNVSHLSRYWLGHRELYTTGANIVHPHKRDTRYLANLGLPATTKEIWKADKQRWEYCFGPKGKLMPNTIQNLSGATVVFSDGSKYHKNLKKALRQLRNVKKDFRKIDDLTCKALHEQILRAVVNSHNMLVRDESLNSKNLGDVENVYRFGHSQGIIQKMMCYHVPSTDYYESPDHPIALLDEDQEPEALFQKKKFQESNMAPDSLKLRRRLFHNHDYKHGAEIAHSKLAPRVTIISIDPDKFRFNSNFKDKAINMSTIIYVEGPDLDKIKKDFDIDGVEAEKIYFNALHATWAAKTAAVMLWNSDTKAAGEVDAMADCLFNQTFPSVYHYEAMKRKWEGMIDKDVMDNYSKAVEKEEIRTFFNWLLSPLGYHSPKQAGQTRGPKTISEANKALLRFDEKKLKAMSYPSLKERNSLDQSHYSYLSRYAEQLQTRAEWYQNRLDMDIFSQTYALNLKSRQLEAQGLQLLCKKAYDKPQKMKNSPIAFEGMGIGTEVNVDDNGNEEPMFWIKTGTFVPILRGWRYGALNETLEQYDIRVANHLEGTYKTDYNFNIGTGKDGENMYRLVLKHRDVSADREYLQECLSGDISNTYRPGGDAVQHALCHNVPGINLTGRIEFFRSCDGGRGVYPSTKLDIRYFPGICRMYGKKGPNELLRVIEKKVDKLCKVNFTLPNTGYEFFIADAIVNSVLWDNCGVEILEKCDVWYEKTDDLHTFSIDNCLVPALPVLKLYAEESLNKRQFTTGERFGYFPYSIHKPKSAYAGTIPICIQHDPSVIKQKYYGDYAEPDTESSIPPWAVTSLINHYHTNRFVATLGANTDYASGGEFYHSFLTRNRVSKFWFIRKDWRFRRDDANFKHEMAPADYRPITMSRRRGLELPYMRPSPNILVDNPVIDEGDMTHVVLDSRCPNDSLERLGLMQFAPVTKFHDDLNKQRNTDRIEELKEMIKTQFGEDFFNTIESNYANAVA